MVSQHITYWGKEYTDIKSTSISKKERKKGAKNTYQTLLNSPKA